MTSILSSDERQALIERASRFPEAWRPTTKGETLSGELIELDMRASDYGEPYPVLTVLDGAGIERSWHAFHGYARGLVARKRPQIGDYVVICFHGVGEAAKVGMNPPVRWNLVVHRAAPVPIDWTAVAGSADDEPDSELVQVSTDVAAPSSSSGPTGPSDEIPF
jgi:hypothetical protein